MPPKLNVVTGATGLLGSHIAEALRARGERVRALVRPGSDTSFLRGLDVEIVPGDLLDPATIRPAVNGADIVYHAAARVGNWGKWKAFRTEVIDTTRNLLDACRDARVGRVLHVSSLFVYGHPREPESGWITEDEPHAQRLGYFDFYCRAKEEAERLALDYESELTIVRPSWIFGPRDRNGFPRLVKALSSRWISIIGDGSNLLNIVYAADVADGCIRAANHLGGRGQAYHLCSEGAITQRQFFDCLTEGLGLPRVTRHRSLKFARWGGLMGEVIGRALFWPRPPHVSQYGVHLLTRSTHFSIAKARTELGWQPLVSPQDGLRQTLEWFRQRHI
jgi:2-alkyl-3-oxoalkanoate reductase